MKSRMKMLLGATLLGSVVLAGGVAMAQGPQGMSTENCQPGLHHPGPHFGEHEGFGVGALLIDPAQLPETKGKVAQYTLSPRGDVVGLVLADGTEVHLPPHLSTALVFSVKPGDEVSIRGLKLRDLPTLVAVQITNTASGAVVGNSAGGHGPAGNKQEVSGKVKAQLHALSGEVDGVLLEDGTTVRLPPLAAAKHADLLKPGSTLFVRGFGNASPLGKAVAAIEIGASADKLVQIERFRPEHEGGFHPGPMGGEGMQKWREEMIKHHHPDGAPPPPPPPGAPK